MNELLTQGLAKRDSGLLAPDNKLWTPRNDRGRVIEARHRPGGGVIRKFDSGDVRVEIPMARLQLGGGIRGLLKAMLKAENANAAAGTWTFYNSFKEFMADGTIDLDGDTFRMLLTTSTYTPVANTHDELADITNELSGSGYARFGHTATWTRSSGTITFDTDDATFTASGGPITARYAVIFDDTSVGDKLVCYAVLDSTPADVSVTDGNTLTVAIHSSGVFTLA